MIADVPVGTMLSGGLDSSAVLYAQHKLGYQDISSWNIGFEGFKDDESSIASNFSQILNIPFYSHEFKGDELDSLIREAIHISDEPFMHMQEPFLLGLCKKAKEKVSVLQSGEASDELLGGYVRYKVQDNNIRYTLLRMLKFVPDKFINDQRWKKMKKYVSSGNRDFQLISNANNIFKSDLDQYGFNQFNFTPTYRNEVLAEAKEFYPNNALRQLMYLEQFTHIPSLNDRNDRVSMGASIENREPFEDYRLYSGVFSLPDKYFQTKGKGKWLLMNSIGKKLPEEITNHRKIGLSIPWFDHFKNSHYFKENMQTIHKSPLFQTKCFEGIDIKKMVEDNLKYSYSKSIFFKMLFLHIWHKEYFK